jgi:hypothetical protein
MSIRCDLDRPHKGKWWTDAWAKRMEQSANTVEVYLVTPPAPAGNRSLNLHFKSDEPDTL